jgi:hypothetical protein
MVWFVNKMEVGITHDTACRDGSAMLSDRKVAGERGSRTHLGLLATPPGFEVRSFHQEAQLSQ